MLELSIMKENSRSRSLISRTFTVLFCFWSYSKAPLFSLSSSYILDTCMHTQYYRTWIMIGNRNKYRYRIMPLLNTLKTPPQKYMRLRCLHNPNPPVCRYFEKKVSIHKATNVCIASAFRESIGLHQKVVNRTSTFCTTSAEVKQYGVNGLNKRTSTENHEFCAAN